MREDFFNEETICGHLVTSKMKRLWAVELGCFEELKRICEKYDIKYYALGGTLLGAVRHNGFIPWDDDMDVVMYADDYYRFCELAPKELSYPYFFQDFNTEPGFGPSKARIRNTETTGCTKFDYEFADENYNCGCFIDIFPMFGVETSKWRFILQKMLMSFWIKPITGFEMLKKVQHRGKMRWFMPPFMLCWMFFSIFTDHKNLCHHFLKACSMAKHYDKVGLLAFAGFSQRWIWSKEWYVNIQKMPFEGIEISCPFEYDKVLRKTYGDYHVYQKGKAVHTMVLWDPDISYKEKLGKLQK